MQQLVKRVQHPQLQDTVKALEVGYELDIMSYSEAYNHLTAAVSKIPEYHFSWKVYGIHASGGNIGVKSGGISLYKCGRNSSNIYNSQGKVHTGYYYNWRGRGKEYFKTIISARNKNGSKSIQTASNKYVAYTKLQISELSSTLTEMKACIAAFSGKPQGTNSSESKSGQEAPVSRDKGNSFVGCASERTKTWLASPLALALFGLIMFIIFTFRHG